MSSIMDTPSRADQKLASDALARLKEVAQQFQSGSEAGVKMEITETGESLTIPKKALSLLLTILSDLSEGKSLTVMTTDAEVSTQQAADMLKVSRPHVVKLLEGKVIPFKKVGSHRRIRLKDLLVYQQRLQQTREEKLKYLSEQAQELKLGYD